MYDSGSKSLYEYLKVKQIQCLREVANRNDIIACLPTGYGKSLIYDMLPYFSSATDSIVVVISPLRVIVSSTLHRHGLEAYEVSKDAVSDERFINGNFRFLVGFPETFLDKDICHVMKRWQCKVEWIVIDEAHCILQWGSSFRPDYGNIVKLRTIFVTANVLALTATATKKAVTQLSLQLALKVSMYECNNCVSMVSLLRVIKIVLSLFLLLNFTYSLWRISGLYSSIVEHPIYWKVWVRIPLEANIATDCIVILYIRE